MSGPRQIGPKGPELALAEAHLGYLNNVKVKYETKVVNCERVLSILRSHLEHLEKKNASQGVLRYEQEVDGTNTESLESLDGDGQDRVDGFGCEGEAYLEQQSLDAVADEDDMSDYETDENGEYTEAESEDEGASGDEEVAEQEDIEYIDLTAEEEDVAEEETSGDESPSEDEDNSNDRARISGMNHNSHHTPEDSESEEDAEERRREYKAWKAKMRLFQAGNEPPCDDPSHPLYCKHAQDPKYNGLYGSVSSDDSDSDSDEDAMSVQDDGGALLGELANDKDEEGGHDVEATDALTPPSDDEGGGASDSGNEHDPATNLASDSEQAEDPLDRSESASDNAPDEPAATENAKAQNNNATLHISELEKQLPTLKLCRDELNTLLDPVIAYLTNLISQQAGIDGPTDLENIGYMVLAQMFAKDAGSVEAFLADLRELENPDEDKEPVEIDEAGETEEEHGEDSDLAGSVAEQGEVEAEIELHTPTVQRPVLDVFSTPIMGGKRDREVDEEEGDTSNAKRPRLERSDPL